MQYEVEYIREKLSSSIKWIERAIIVLYERQTQEEKEGEGAFEQNNMGFNSSDAPSLSQYATILLSNKSLTPLQLEDAKKRLPKYAKQILSLIPNN